MAVYVFDSNTNTFVLVDDSFLGTDSSLGGFSVATDLADYAPGSTANVTATVGVGDTVTFNVADVAGTAVSGTNQPWTVTDGGAGDLDGVANGVIRTSWAVGMDAAGEAFSLSAIDQTAGVMMTAGFTDSPHTPVQAVVPSNLTNGIKFLTGDTNTATGTGIFPSFVTIQHTGVEQGFNTDAAPVQDSGSSPAHNHSLLLNAVPIVTIDGVAYREFRLDLNEQSDPISLDKLQIYAATSGNLTSLAGLTQIYDMDGGADGKTGGAADVDVSVGLTAWSSGSGHSDYKVLIPDSYFAGTSPGAYIYLYSQFSNADAGFEEWSVGPVSPSGKTPDAVVGIDKQISVDGTNWQDVGLYGIAPGSDDAPTLLAGSTVYYKVIVTNQTMPNASNVDPKLLLTSLTDDPALTFQYVTGDANNNGLIDLGESWTYTASTMALDGLQPGGNGQLVQIDKVTAVGTVTDANGTTTGTNSDQANYIGLTPRIAVDKVTVDGTLDANGNLVLVGGKGAVGDNLTIIAGENITWEYKVSNTGDVALSGVTVADDHAGVGPTGLMSGGFNVGDINQNGKLDTNETWVFTATGTAIDGPYTNKGTASGSFTDDAGHVAAPSASDTSGYTGVMPAIAIDKVTVDGALDANGNLVLVGGKGAAGDNLTIIAGENIIWEYKVTNSGDVALSNVAVADDKAGVTPTGLMSGGFNVGDANQNGLLDTTETWIYTATGTAIDGIYSNKGTAGGSFTDSAGHTAAPSASDISGYTGVKPAIAVDKVTADGTLDGYGNLVLVGGKGAAGDNLTIIAGENIIWEYKVTNSGDVALSNVAVADDKAGVTPTGLMSGGFNVGDANQDGKLDTNETWIFTATGTAIDGAYTNKGTASGSFTDSAGHTATPSASDTSGYTGVKPAIAIDKVTVDGTLDGNGNLVLVGGKGAAGDNLTIIAGENIIWEYKVSNSGDVALSNVAVTDNQAGVTPTGLMSGGFNVGDANHNGLLDTTETWIYTAAGTAIDGAYTNKGTASGSFTDSAGHTAAPTASDTSSYSGVKPAIHIEKVTTGVDSVTIVNNVVTPHTATGDGLSFLAGYGVTWTYTVTNAGDVPLSSIVVSDNQPGVSPTAVLQADHVHNVGDSNGNGLLDVGESWTFTASGTSILGNYNNTGTASGLFTDSAHHTVAPTDDDVSSYTGTFVEQGGTLTQGFWGSHTDAWDGVLGKESNPTKSAFKGGDISALDINPRHDGNLLLGDSNGDGIANDAHNLLISDTLAASLLSASTGGDARIIMLQQTIAAQLNIDNGKVQPNDLIDEAVMWLTGKGAWSGNGFTVDANNDGIIDSSGGKLAGSAVATSGNAWQKYVDVTNPASITDWNGGKEADGEGLKNALMWWNDGHLVTSTSGQVAYDTNGTSAGGINPATVNLNTMDEFWVTLHQQTSLTGIA